MSRIFRNKTYFIAEIGVNHNGSLKLAKKMIKEAKKAGANAVKFQTFKADLLASPRTPKVKYQRSTTSKKESHYDMLKSLELSEKNHHVLKNFCKKEKIDFLSTPYNLQSAKFLDKIGCKVFKTASADIVDLELHTYLAKNKKKVIISTGMSNFNEVDECIDLYKKYSNKNFILLHCVSNYPCSLSSLNLSIMPEIQKRYNCHVGYSDHSIGNDAAILSFGMGARVIEKHFTTNKNLKGPDHKASSLPHEFREMVTKIRLAETMMGKTVKKCQLEEMEMRKVSRKSLTLNMNIKKGEILKKKLFVLKRPGTGLYYKDLKKILGKKTKKKLYKDYQIKLVDIE